MRREAVAPSAPRQLLRAPLQATPRALAAGSPRKRKLAQSWISSCGGVALEGLLAQLGGGGTGDTGLARAHARTSHTRIVGDLGPGG